MDMSGMDMDGGSTYAMTMKSYIHGSTGGDVLWFRTWQPQTAGATAGVCIGLFLLAVFDRYVHALWRACSAAWAKGQVGALPTTGGALEYTQVAVDAKSADAAPVAVTTATAAPSGCGTCRRPTGDKEKDAALDIPGRLGCDCGCGGECGSSSAPAPVYQSQPSTPEGDEKLSRTGTPVQASSIRAAGSIIMRESAESAFAHLPAAVRRSLGANNTDGARVRRRWSRPWSASVDVPRGFLYAFKAFLDYALMLVVMTFQIYWIISLIIGLGVGEMLFGRFGPPATR